MRPYNCAIFVHITAMSPAKKIVRHGIEKKRNQQKLFDLADRFRNATDPKWPSASAINSAARSLAVNTPTYSEVSSFSAISSIFVTLFQFLPVPGIFSVFSSRANDSFERPMPLGK